MKLTKKRKKAEAKVQPNKHFTLKEASGLVKETTTAAFNASVDVHIRLGVDPRKADQLVRGTVSLPHGTGKEKKVLVLCSPEREEEAKNAGADFVGMAEYTAKIEQGWTGFDVAVATPDVMPKIAKLGKILGPRNLMPNPKSGTVTDNLAGAIKDLKGGKIAFKVDKFGIIHAAIGRTSFSEDQLTENANEILSNVIRLKPASAKGIYIKSVYITSTMGPGIPVDHKVLNPTV